MPQKIPQQTSTSHPIQYNKENINEPLQALLVELPCTAKLCNEPSSFESEDSKSRMLLNNFPSGKIVNEPEEKVKTFSIARLSEKSKDFSDNKRTKPYIITRKIVYESCAIGCKWYMIYK
jgi:hypothetical protein